MMDIILIIVIITALIYSEFYMIKSDNKFRHDMQKLIDDTISHSEKIAQSKPVC